jgi:hypothetical protein
MDTNNLIRAVLFGVVSTIIGIIIYYIFLNISPSKECFECNKKNYTMEISYFFIGFILYFLLKINLIKNYFI